MASRGAPAAWVLDPDGPPGTTGWRTVVFGVASEPMVGRTVVLAAAATTGVLLAWPGAVGAGRDDNVIRTGRDQRVVSLGSWNVSHVENRSLADAIRVFGRPDLARHSTEHDGYNLRLACDWGRALAEALGRGNTWCTCLVRWRAAGLTAGFSYSRRRDWSNCASRGTYLQFFQTADRTWVTDRGLRVGDPTPRLRTLYPCATHPYVGTQIGIWNLTQKQQSLGQYRGYFTVTVETKSARVKTLRAEQALGARLEPCPE